MSTYMYHELLLFFCSLGAGVGIVFFYDWIRILRALIPHSAKTVSLTDFLYWMAVAIYLFSLMYRKNDGIIRSYAILGILSGMAGYRWCVREYFVNTMVKIVGIPMKIVKKPLKRLLFGIRRVKLNHINSLCSKISVGWKLRFQKIERRKE